MIVKGSLVKEGLQLVSMQMRKALLLFLVVVWARSYRMNIDQRPLEAVEDHRGLAPSVAEPTLSGSRAA